jgi:hypothetical protein
MKKLITLLAVLFTVTAFAQDTKPEQKYDTKTTKQTPPNSHECYWMKDNMLLHCMGPKQEPQKTEVKLQNGTTISPTGVVKAKDGSKTQLENGQCVSLMGSIGDCEKMHMADERMPNDNVK